MSVSWHQAYDGGRIVAKSGAVEIGAIFPADSRWLLWVGGSVCPATAKGQSKTVLGAKTALLAAWSDFLARASLEEVA